ncbi:MAG: response regulator transcription factor [Acidobacteria bacterium]|nr:response regulator transcription factor [Acidobacteriota bacterium]
MRLLLIDDDRELAQLVSEYLIGHGFGVEVAYDGTSGLARALEANCDVVLLDGMLPGLDGIEVLRQLRQRSSVAVIMLTARGAPGDRITGLNTGADDYLAKPFAPDELLARIRAVMRRMQPAEPKADVVSLGGLTLDSSQREAWLGDAACNLTGVQFEILGYLMRNPGRSVSRDEFTALLHHRESTPFERSLDGPISQLRKKTEADGKTRIHTVRGVGYMFSAPKEIGE